jgi:hypothetical protein
MTNSIQVVRDGSCPSLSGKSTLTYEVGAGPAADVYLRIRKNSGAGYFSTDWVAWEAIEPEWTDAEFEALFEVADHLGNLAGLLVRLIDIGPRSGGRYSRRRSARCSKPAACCRASARNWRRKRPRAGRARRRGSKFRHCPDFQVPPLTSDPR